MQFGSKYFSQNIAVLLTFLTIPPLLFYAKFILKDPQIKIGSLLSLNKQKWTQVSMNFAFGVILCVLVSVSVIGYTYAKGIDLNYHFNLNFSFIFPALIIFLAVLVEEIIFRGIIQQLFQKYFTNYWSPILLSSLLFSLSHFQFFQEPNGIIFFLDTFVFSVLLGFVFIRNRSIVPTIMIHFGWNITNDLLLAYGENYNLISALNIKTNDYLVEISSIFAIFITLIATIIIKTYKYEHYDAK